MSKASWGIGAVALMAMGCDGSAGTPPMAGPVSGFEGGEPGIDFGAQSSLPGAVVRSERALRPVSGGTLLVLRDQKTAVVADPDRDQLFVVDLQRAAVSRTISLEAGAEPGRAVEDAAGVVHVALRGSGQLVSLDPSRGELLGARSVCAYPRGVASAEGVVHVACAEGKLVSLSTDPKKNEPVRTLTLERDLRDVVIASDGLWVSLFRAAEVLRLDSTGKVLRRMFLPSLAGSQGESVSSVAWRMVPGATGGVVVVHQRAFAGEVVASAGGYGATGASGGMVSTAITIVTEEGSAQGTSVALAAPLPVDVAQSPVSGRFLLAAAAVEHPVEGSRFGRNLLLRPSQLALSAQPTETFVDGEVEAAPSEVPRGQLVAVAFAGDVPVLQYREPSSLVVGSLGIELPGESLEDTGSQLFHLETSSGLACASCHPEGQEDGRTWHFSGFGPRRTQSLRGGLLGTEPFHWDGLETDFAALTGDVMQGRMGGPQLDAEQNMALASYLDVLPAMPAPAASRTASVERGEALFNDATVGCATCHSGSRFSNDQTVDVGSLDGVMQVPGLVGLWARAPYLHDGCAKTLLDRFTTCDTGKHGVVSQLKSEDLRALTDYLETL
ncbi:MAG: cytochrome-c peroxidase [Myxococcales bacterium]|nr:MAG: cytochrome-c peroxidase [Myxococcales bacterium]